MSVLAATATAVAGRPIALPLRVPCIYPCSLDDAVVHVNRLRGLGRPALPLRMNSTLSFGDVLAPQSMN